MQQLMAFFLVIFMFAGTFAVSAGAIADRQGYRIAKQELNLLGREVVNHIRKDSVLQVDAHAFLHQIATRGYQGEIIGCIFFYGKQIQVLKIKEGIISDRRIDVTELSERNRINTVNNMVNFLAEQDTERYEINIAAADSNDYLAEELFNRLQENTVFILGYHKNRILLSGFRIE